MLYYNQTAILDWSVNLLGPIVCVHVHAFFKCSDHSMYAYAKDAA